MPGLVGFFNSGNNAKGGVNHDNVLCLGVTFELWLKQVFEQEYRNI